MIDVGSIEQFKYGNDPIVIRKYLDGLKGGVVLDLTGYTEDHIKGGHVIIRDTSTKKIYKPMPLSGGAYDSLPGGYEYVGVCTCTAEKEYPFVGVCTAGEVNDVACPYSMDSIMSAFKSAVPTIRWEHD